MHKDAQRILNLAGECQAQEWGEASTALEERLGDYSPDNYSFDSSVHSNLLRLAHSPNSFPVPLPHIPLPILH
jgi:hypothetical protein